MNDLFLINKDRNQKEIDSDKVVLESKPCMLMVVLTTRCNLQCIMCSRRNPNEDLTLPVESIKQIIGLFPYLGAIDWQGGEVFLVDYFKDLFLEASSYPNIDQSVITNGLLINKEWAETFAKAKTNLTYSVDAVTKDTYEYIRKGAKFEDLLRSLDVVSETNKRYNNPLSLHMNVVVMRSNYRQLGLFPEFCQRYGIKHLRFDFLRPDVVPQEDILLRADIEAVEYLRNELGDIEKEAQGRDIWFEYTFRSLLFPSAEIPGHIGRKPRLKCELPWKKLYIDAGGNGIIRPDCLCQHNAGNIMDHKIDEVWNNEIMQLYRRNLIEGNIQNWCSEACLHNTVDKYHLKGSQKL